MYSDPEALSEFAPDSDALEREAALGVVCRDHLNHCRYQWRQGQVVDVFPC